MNAPGTEGATPAVWPLRRGNLDGFGKLLELGANPNQVFDGGRSTVMSWAAELEGDFLKVALEHGGDPNLVCPYNGHTPLFDLMLAPDYMEKIPLLVKWGADVNFQKSGVYTPAMLLATDLTLDAVPLLLELGADAGFTNHSGSSLAHKLSSYVSGPFVHLINDDNAPHLQKAIDTLEARGIEIPEYAPPEETRFAKGSTKLTFPHVLFPSGQLRAAYSVVVHNKLPFDELDRLVAEGLDVNARGMFGATLLMVMVGRREGLAATAKLLELGADPNVIYDDGTTVMHRAASGDEPAVWDLLLQFGGDPNLADPKQGKTPLFEAIKLRLNRSNYLERIVKMLDSGVDINHQALNGDTPVIAAAMLMDYQTVDLLLGRGADHRPANRVTGRTLMDWIAYHRHRGRLPFETVRWMEKAASRLERRGAQIPQWEAAEAERG